MPMPDKSKPAPASPSEASRAPDATSPRPRAATTKPLKPRTSSNDVPTPPDPKVRRRALPTDKPKPPEEDPLAAARLQAILASPSYRRPDADPDFLSRDDVRAVRLMLDYMKPELILEQIGVKQTVVVFGSTRI